MGGLGRDVIKAQETRERALAACRTRKAHQVCLDKNLVNTWIQKHKIRNTFNRSINSSFIGIQSLNKCKLFHQFITPQLLILVET